MVEEAQEAEIVSDEITCTKCAKTEERVAQPGQVLQPSQDYVCDACQDAHNENSGATAAEAARVAAEKAEAEGGLPEVEVEQGE